MALSVVLGSTVFATAAGAAEAAGSGALRVTSVTPARAAAGHTVDIVGSDLSQATRVRFNGAAARFKVLSPSKLEAVVPTLATTGPVSVTAGTLTASGPLIIVPPTITSFSPGSGTPGTVVTITGTALTGATSVTFGNTLALFSVVSATEVVATVPSQATSGPISINNAHGTATSAASFAVVGPQLTLSQPSASPGCAITVAGSGFAPAEFIDLYFDTTLVADTTTDAAGSFAPVPVTVPASAAVGSHLISAKGERSGLAADSKFTIAAWTSFGDGPAHGSDDTSESVLATNNVGGLGLDWADSTYGNLDSSPVVANGVAYADTDGGILYAVSASSGAALWSFTSGAAPIYGSPAVANGIVYVATGSGEIDALSTSTGAQLWSFTIPAGIYSSPTVANGVAYVASGNDFVYALSASTGSLIWESGTGGPITSSPAVSNGVLYVGSDDHSVYAFNASTGLALWSFATGAAVESPPAVANGVLYVGSDDDNVYALSASTGMELWSFATGAAVSSSPAVANGVVYVGSDDDNVYALSASTGTKLWSYTTGSQVRSSPAVANGVVYFGSLDDSLYAVSASTGTKLWSYATGSSVYSSPAIDNGVVYAESGQWSFGAYAL